VALTLATSSVVRDGFLASSASGFSGFDDRLADARPGFVLLRAESQEVVSAILAHAARRLSATGTLVVRATRRPGASMLRQLGDKLGVRENSDDPARFADALGRALFARKAVVVAPLPLEGSWDRVVLLELAHAPRTLMVIGDVLGEAGRVSAAGLPVESETFDLRSELDTAEKSRFLSAIAEDAFHSLPTSNPADIDAWWESTKRVVGVVGLSGLSAGEANLLRTLALLGRPWPVAQISGLFQGADDALAALASARAVIVENRPYDKTVEIHEPYAAIGAELARDGQKEDCAAVATLLSSHGPLETDPWAMAQAADLWLRAGDAVRADEAHARAIAAVADTAARRELVNRWYQRVSGLADRVDALRLATNSATRAIAAGESEEARRWSECAAALGGSDAGVMLLLGRACVGVGDLVAAKVALGKATQLATTDDVREDARAELAEVSYQNGDLAGARELAESIIHGRGGNIAAAIREDVRLRARNTLGKLLLIESRWDEADSHFAEDVWSASRLGDRTAELRARLNRGIALLSKSLVDEAQAVFTAVLSEGETSSDARAQAFALDNLAVIATRRHSFMDALSLMERAVKLRQRLGDRIRMARVLGNLADLRHRLGLFEHAEHSVRFGRRALGPGMPPARSSHFAVVAARIALSRGNTVDAKREITQAIVDGEAAKDREFLGEAFRVSARIALEDGDVVRATNDIERSRLLSTRNDALAETAILSVLLGRAQGIPNLDGAEHALGLAREAGDEDLLREAHQLLAMLFCEQGDLAEARAHHTRALAVRDQVANALTGEVRTAFLAKPDVVALSRLGSTFAEETSKAWSGSREGSSALRPSDRPEMRLIGDDPQMVALKSAIVKVARSNATVLIHGESGTGKELVADALHRASERSSGPLVTVNCAALVETLLLSELFGHEKGAFTGASGRRRGRFELAENGTLFLDEIGDISARTQVALLRVLQERTFERVGGAAPIRCNVRVICATHRDLRAMVDRGEFREDLYYRLRGITLEVPALRQRLGDLGKIAETILGKVASERSEAAKTLAPEALELLARHRWPGNVRELENVLRAVSLFADGMVITAEDLVSNVDDLRAVAQSAPSTHTSNGPVTLRASLTPPPSSFAVGVGAANSSPSFAEDSDEEGDVALPEDEANATAVAYAQVRQGAVSLTDIKRQIERDCIARALRETKGNITRAAALLGMKRPRLSQLVKQYGLMAASTEGA
jgi:transcriptional regulator with GAF, ATPase, and Fis domain